VKTGAGKRGIPAKRYFRIGEVSALVGVDAHVLRYWESEFPSLRPHRSSTRQRLYRRRDVETLLRIKELLYEQGYTISGARKVLREERRTRRETDASGVRPSSPEAGRLRLIRRELEAILSLLGRDGDGGETG